MIAEQKHFEWDYARRQEVQAELEESDFSEEYRKSLLGT